MRYVAALPAAGLLAGSAAGYVVGVPPAPARAVLIALAVVAASAWWARKSVVLAAVVMLAFFVGGAALATDAWRAAWQPTLRVAFERLAADLRSRAALEGRRLPEDDEAFATITGVLRADAAPVSSGVLLSLDVDSIRGESTKPQAVSGGAQVSVVGVLAGAQLDEWRAGRRLRLPVQLRRPSRYLDRGVLDFERALARSGTTLVGTVKSGALVEVLAAGTLIDESLGAVRAYARRTIVKTVGSASSRSAAIVNAIVIGDRTALDDEVQRRLQNAGTYHVIAISGGNIAILAGLILGTFRAAGLLGRAARLAAIGMLTAYARLVGGGASVDRATLMAVVYLAAASQDQRSPPLNALALAAACLVVLQPLSTLNPAFLLTFGATLAILRAAPLAGTWNVPRLLLPAVAMLAASLATEVALLPVGAVAFSRVTFAGLALNFAAIPLMAVTQIAGMALVPLALFSTRAATAVGYVAHLAATALVRSADLVELAPGLVVRVAPPGVVIVALYYVALAGACLLDVRRGWRVGALGVAVLAAVWIVAEPWTLAAARGDGLMHVTFLDVGQGDSAFLRLPHGSSMLVDAGGLSSQSSFDMGDRVVAPVLREAGVRQLDVLVVTHGDPDHIGGAAAVIREFRPREIWEGIPVPRFEPLRLLRAEAEAAGSRWLARTAGDRARIDDVDVIVRHPEPADWERQRVRNDDSVVIELTWRDVSVVLTGDIGSAVEHAIVGALAPAPIRIVKIPHHGSLTSSSVEFVRALAPTVAVVSAGRANHFGHPAPAVLQRYLDAQVEVFRTDRDGEVTIDTDGTSIHVHTFRGRAYSFSPGHWNRAESDRHPDRILAARQCSSSWSSDRSRIARPDSVMACSIVSKRRANLSVALRSAASGSMPSLRDRLAMAKSRSPISSSARLASEASSVCVPSASLSSATSSSIFAITCASCSQSKPSPAARVPILYARRSAGRWRGTPPRMVCVLPLSARSRAFSVFHRSRAASGDGARSLDSASCTRPSS